MINKFLFKNIILIILIAFLVHNVTYAQSHTEATSNDFFRILDGIHDKFYNAAYGWQAAAESLARKLFFSLIFIDILILGIYCVIKKTDLKQIFDGFLFKVIFLGGFLGIMQWLPYLTDPKTGILASFEIAGAQISNTSRISPTGFIDVGIDIVSSITHSTDSVSLFNIFNSLMTTVVIFIIMYSFFILAFELLATKIEAYILMFGGCFFLAFAGSQYTKQYAVGYLRYTFNVGIKLFFIFLYLSLGIKIASEIKSLLDTNSNINLYTQLIIAATFLLYASIAKRITQIVNGFVSGMTSTSGSEHMGSITGMALSASSTASNVATGSGGGLASIANNAGKMLGSAVVKGAGHAHAAGRTFSNSFKSNRNSGDTKAPAVSKAIIKTVSTAASNVGDSIDKTATDAMKNVKNMHETNIKSSPFTPKQPPAPNKTSQESFFKSNNKSNGGNKEGFFSSKK